MAYGDDDYEITAYHKMLRIIKLFKSIIRYKIHTGYTLQYLYFFVKTSS